MTVFAILLLAAAQDAPAEAKKLFDTMDERFAKASTAVLECEIEGYFVQEGDKAKCTVVLARGHRFNYSLGMGADPKAPVMTAVSDGMQVVVSAGGKVDTRPVRGAMESNLFAGLARMGVMGTVAQAYEGDRSRLGPDERYLLSEFRSGKDEKVGGRTAKVVHYKASYAGKTPMDAKLWIDAETGLPLKRVLIGSERGRDVVVTETVTSLKLGEEIKPETFALPK